MSKTERVIIVGGPSRGKSTLAHSFHERGIPVFCGDPRSKVVYTKPYTTYLPEGLPMSGDDGAAQWVADNWFTMKGPWVCEGWLMARALRRWLQCPPTATRTIRRPGGYDVHAVTPLPCDRILVLNGSAHRETSKGQEAMHKAVMTVWSQVAHYFRDISEDMPFVPRLPGAQ